MKVCEAKGASAAIHSLIKHCTLYDYRCESRSFYCKGKDINS